MEAPAKNLPNRHPNGKFQTAPIVIEPGEWEDVAAKLYGLGFKRAQIAQKLAPLFGDAKTARRKLTKLEQKKEFRDLIYQYAVVKMDLELPEVLKGVTRSAKRGRIDAAKLVLAVTDRHTDKSDAPQHVVLELSGLHRPHTREIPASTTDTDLRSE